MKQYVQKKDLDLINFILERGNNVTIKRTSYAVSIISEDVKVMQKVDVNELPDSKEAD